MEALKTAWSFFQDEILGMAWLNRLIGAMLSTFGLDTDGKIGGSIQFFIYDMIKIMVLLSILIFIISYIQSFFPPERTKKILGHFHGIGANIIAALLGTVTPFCSCSSIPLFIGFTSAGLPLGVTFSFLISSTSEQAILRYLGEKDGVTLRIYTRHVTAAEEKRIIANAANKNRMQRSSTNNLQQTVAAESNLQDVAQLAADMHRNREPLLHVAVFIEMISDSLDNLRILQTEVQTELVRSKLNVDKLMLRQQHGFMSVMPSGRNMFKEQFERVIPASSTANLYPFSFSGKTDEQGFYLGKDRYGGNIIVDFDKRDDDKTNSNALILGNSGQGKSYLLKLILTNLREKGKSIICLDPESEYVDLTLNLGGCFIDLMSGEYVINVLEPKTWDDGSNSDEDAPQAFKSKTKLSQHISFLRDFFRCYKDFTDREIDTIELLLIKLYENFSIGDDTNWNGMILILFKIIDKNN